MKTKLKFLAIMGFAFGAMLKLHAQGYIVPNGVTYVGNFPVFGAEIHVLQNPTNGDYTGFFFTPQSSNTFLFNPLLDEGVRTFLVSSNSPVSLQAILANNYTELTYPNIRVFANGTPFYLGLYTGYNPWVFINGISVYTGIYTDPVFAWGRFVNNNGVIQMLDSALEYGGGGIYAGTQNIIPEPGVFGLSALSGLLLGLRRWQTAVRRPQPTFHN